MKICLQGQTNLKALLSLWRRDSRKVFDYRYLSFPRKAQVNSLRSMEINGFICSLADFHFDPIGEVLPGPLSRVAGCDELFDRNPYE